ncbi:HYR-like domain-containing protein, partial [Portibacter marinus]
DNTAPTADPISAIGPFSCYADIPAPDVSVVIGEMDDCGGAVTIAFVSDSADPGCSGTVTRTYSLTDVCGNTANITQNITIDDNTAPTADPIPAIGPFSCYADIPAPDVTVVTGEMDDCGGVVNVAFVSDSANPGCSGTVTRTYSLTDVCGNSINITQNISIDDNTPPTADPLPVLGPFNCYANRPPPNVNDVTGEMDNCGGTVMVTHLSDTGNPGCNGTVTRTYRLTDQCGRSANITQQILIQDTIPPTANPLTDLGPFNCYSQIPNGNVNQVIGETDNCGGLVQVTNFWTDPNPGCSGTILRYYRIVDACGNADTLTQNITIFDNQGPILSGVPANITLNCSATHPAFNVTATDNCNNVASIVLDTTAINQTNTGNCTDFAFNLTRRWTATDDCGNTTSATQRITYIDNTSPSITAPANITISCADSQDTTFTGSPVVSDNCDNNVSILYSDNISFLGCANESAIQRTFIATDACGNTSSATQLISVEDNTPPVWINFPADYSVGCPDDLPDPDSTLMATDNCGTVTVEVVTQEFIDLNGQPGFCPSSLQIVYRATDACGNFVQDTLEITVLAECGCNECESSVPFQFADLRDNPDSLWIGAELKRDGNCCNNRPNVECQAINLYLNPNTVAIQVNDVQAPSFGSEFYQVNCGTEEVFGKFICVDGPGPHIITICKPGKEKQQIEILAVSGVLVPEDITTRIGCDYTITVEGNIDESTVTWTDVSGNGYESYLSCTSGCLTSTFLPGPGAPTTVQYEVCGEVEPPDVDNVLEGCLDGAVICDIVTVTVFPEIDLLLEGPREFCEGEVVTLTATPQPPGTYDIYWYNAYDAGGTLLQSDLNVGSAQFSPTMTGQYSAYVVEKISGLECNQDTFDFDILVNPLPVFDLGVDSTICIENVYTIDLPDGFDYEWTPTDGVTEGADSTIFNIAPLSVGTYNYTVTATSPAGCVSTDTWTLDVINCLECSEVTICPTDTFIIANVSDFVNAGGVLGFPCTVDNSSLQLLSSVSSNTTCPEIITNTYQITDICGNQSQCDFIITRLDTILPTFTCAPNITIEACSEAAIDTATGLAFSEMLAEITLSDYQNSGGNANDNCDLFIFYQDVSTGNCPTSVVRTFTFTDLCDNTQQCQQSITVEDTTVPEYTCPPDTTVIGCDISDLEALTSLPFSNVVNSITIAEFNTAGGSTSDECDVRDIWYIDNASGMCPITINRTFTIADSCGNEAICIQQILINDTIPPTFTVPTDLTIYKDDDCLYDAGIGQTGDVTDEMDNCSVGLEATFTDVESIGVCDDETVITRTWTLVDD